MLSETAARAFVQFQIAYSIDKDYYKELYCRWIDAGANLKQMSQEKNGKELRQVYIKLLELGGELDKLMIQLYVRLLPSLFNAEIEEEKFKVDIDKLVKINYSNVAEEEYNMRLFAEVVIPYIKRENVNCSCACSSRFDNMSEDFIDRTLDSIARGYGKKKFDKIKRFLSEIGKIKRQEETEGKGVGLSGGEITFNDGQIDFYRRTAGKTIRIVEKPLQSDFADEIREGYSDFVLGDVILEAR